MSKKISILVIFVIITGVFCADISAQNRKSVSANEVNGTFRYNFTGKYREFSNQVFLLKIIYLV